MPPWDALCVAARPLTVGIGRWLMTKKKQKTRAVQLLGGWRLTDARWPMTNRSHSSAGALRRFECTGGRHLRRALLPPPSIALQLPSAALQVLPNSVPGYSVKRQPPSVKCQPPSVTRIPSPIVSGPSFVEKNERNVALLTDSPGGKDALEGEVLPTPPSRPAYAQPLSP